MYFTICVYLCLLIFICWNRSTKFATISAAIQAAVVATIYKAEGKSHSPADLSADSTTTLNTNIEAYSAAIVYPYLQTLSDALCSTEWNAIKSTVKSTVK